MNLGLDFKLITYLLLEHLITQKCLENFLYRFLQSKPNNSN